MLNPAHRLDNLSSANSVVSICLGKSEGEHAKPTAVLMSALGQKRTFSEVCAMSASPPKADIG
jgi:hypothetical protein